MSELITSGAMTLHRVEQHVATTPLRIGDTVTDKIGVELTLLGVAEEPAEDGTVMVEVEGGAWRAPVRPGAINAVWLKA